MDQTVYFSDKADIFKDIINSYPSKIAIYNNNGDFFYANTWRFFLCKYKVY